MERKRFIVNTTTKPDRLAYLWLAIALVLSLFANGRWAIPLCNFTRVFLLQLPGALILNQPQIKDFNHHFLLASSHLAWFSSPSYAAYWYESDRVG